MKTENEIKAMIESIAKAAFGRDYEDRTITKHCIRKTTYKQDEEGYWSVAFAVMETLPDLSLLAHLDTIISNAGGSKPYLYAGDKWELFINFIVR